ncbi:hypothetical protein KXD40_002525 [Peronospora effusa]|uniref:Tetratricopeptide SHNi-TPR domain-containing protein n=1 Tax=Peronospora effusa TaxID=542832 RepID=A0A425BZ20_9STRA|nr:hypothetical protein DD237_006046 [Peronospora effusa]UIZ26775.1 hypothetical protein KXD40_002525 [Peronospora effusa]CAI5703912.1 unnamed protein product [Peronospora effusa]
MATKKESSSPAQELQTTLTDPRYLRGVSLLKNKRLEEAVVVFEDLLRTLCDVEGKSDSLAVAPIYYEYGHALLCLTEASTSLFGGAVEDAGVSGEKDGEKDTKDSSDDLETAWEVMELARVIYLRYPEDQAVEMQLVRVYTRLGDLGLECDQYEQAKADFEKALLLRRKLLKATNAEDTTQLADLYCQLAIACIYRDSTQDKEQEKEQEKEQDKEQEQEKGEAPNEELFYYVMAGRVMAENIHRVARKCEDKVQVFVTNRVPKYSIEGDRGVEHKGKGKRKDLSSTGDSTLTLQFNGERPEALREEYLTCLKEEQKDTLKADEKTLLEYLEIYLELKEKVDSIIETVKNAVSKMDQGTDEAVTTVGFSQTETSDDAGAPVVNVISVKKRKIEAPAAKSETLAPANSK